MAKPSANRAGSHQLLHDSPLAQLLGMLLDQHSRECMLSMWNSDSSKWLFGDLSGMQFVGLAWLSFEFMSVSRSGRPAEALHPLLHGQVIKHGRPRALRGTSMRATLLVGPS